MLLDEEGNEISAWHIGGKTSLLIGRDEHKENVDINLITLIKNGDYLGADIGLSSARQYETTAAAHLLGYVSAISKEQYDELKDKGYSLNATVGAAGVEAAFEEYLHG